ncbi:uncharacterized protein BDV17DRAFT_296745 [Aspergillus undulatus]|uniref:uncharacterized protein n=1 Tax=Aspergillus undulatus TaxID=1810928 RepID=UPI003CCCB070
MNNSNNTQVFTARDIIMDSFPALAESNRHSSGTGLHKIDFIGKLEYWDDFADEVRAAFQRVDWGRHQRAMSAQVTNGKDVNYTEYYVCGAEISTSARYATHVLNPVGGVAQELGYVAAFCDWTAAGKMLSWSVPQATDEKEDKGKRSIPDYALLVQKETRALGEAKHPWGTLPNAYIQRAQGGGHGWQVSRDMWAAEVKYAFMTNYKATVFLRRENIKGTWTLSYSDTINHNTKSALQQKASEVSRSENKKEKLTEWVKFEDEKALVAESKDSQSGLTSPAGELGEQSTTGSSNTFQLPERLRNPQAQLGQQRAEYREFPIEPYGSPHGDFYKYFVDSDLNLKFVSEWAEDPNDPAIFYHDEAKVRGTLKTPKAAPTSGKGKSKVAFADSADKGPENSTPSTELPSYKYIGRLEAGWKFHEHQVDGKTVKLWQHEWEQTSGYFYHRKYRLQARAP